MTTVFFVVPLLFISFAIGMQLWARSRARAMKGSKVPALPGKTGARLAQASRALVYFWSPACGACKAITPRLRELSRKNPSVFVVDVFEETALAQGLQVMGTPSFVEIEAGTIVGYWLGRPPPEVLARFS